MLKPRNTFIVIFVLACILLNLFAYTLYNKNEQIRNAGNWVQHTYEVISQTQTVFTMLQDMTTTARGYLLSGNNDFLIPFNVADQKLNPGVLSMEQLVSDNPSQIERFKRLGALIQQQRDILHRQIARLKATQAGQMALTSDEITSSKGAMDGVRQLIDQILAEERRLLVLRNEEEKRRQDNYTATILISSLTSVIGLILGSGFLMYLAAKRQQIEHDLISSEQRFSLAIEGMQDGVFDYRVKEKDIYFSPRLKAMLGETDATMPNTTEALNSRIHPDDIEKTKEVSRAYFARETPTYHNVFRIRHRNGRWRWIMSRAAGQWNAQGEPVRLVGAHTDITEQREYEDNLKRMNQELETFTYIASHDLRSPLVNLKGFAGEMKMGLDELEPMLDSIAGKADEHERTFLLRVIREDIPDALRFIHSSVVKMDRLTNGILELSRIGRRELKPELVDVAEVVKHTIGALSHQIHERGIDVTIGSLPSIVADALLIEQVLGNVIDNAIKYLDPKRPGRIEIAGEEMGELMLYQVKDNGRGIKAADMPKIFEIFRRAGNNEGIAGEGMGMSYVKATLRRLGGTIWCDSEEGVGTTFYFTVLNQKNDAIAQRKAA